MIWNNSFINFSREETEEYRKIKRRGKKTCFIIWILIVIFWLIYMSANKSFNTEISGFSIKFIIFIIINLMFGVMIGLIYIIYRNLFFYEVRILCKIKMDNFNKKLYWDKIDKKIFIVTNNNYKALRLLESRLIVYILNIKEEENNLKINKKKLKNRKDTSNIKSVINGILFLITFISSIITIASVNGLMGYVYYIENVVKLNSILILVMIISAFPFIMILYFSVATYLTLALERKMEIEKRMELLQYAYRELTDNLKGYSEFQREIMKI